MKFICAHETLLYKTHGILEADLEGIAGFLNCPSPLLRLWSPFIIEKNFKCNINLQKPPNLIYFLTKLPDQLSFLFGLRTCCPCIHAYMHTCIHAYMHTCIHPSLSKILNLPLTLVPENMLYLCGLALYIANWPDSGHLSVAPYAGICNKRR